MTSNPDFKITIVQGQITRKWYNICLQWPTNKKSYYDLSNGAIFNDLERLLPPVSRSLHFLHWISQKRYDIQFNGILIGTYTPTPTPQCRFEWPWVTFNDLAKYSMTRSVEASRGLSAIAELLIYRATRMHSAVKNRRIADIARTMPSQYVCLSVCLTPVFCQHRWTYPQKKVFYYQVAPPFWFVYTKQYSNIPTGIPLTGRGMQGVWKKSRFSTNILLSPTWCK